MTQPLPPGRNPPPPLPSQTYPPQNLPLGPATPQGFPPAHGQPVYQQTGMTAGAGAPSVRQWEAHVRRMIHHGSNREEIIYAMTAANWGYEDAMALIRRLAASERWKAVWMMIGGVLIAGAFLLLTIVSISATRDGGVIFWGAIVFGIFLFILGLVRLTKMRV